MKDYKKYKLSSLNHFMASVTACLIRLLRAGQSRTLQQITKGCRQKGQIASSWIMFQIYTSTQKRFVKQIINATDSLLTDKWMDIWMDEQIYKWTDGWTDREMFCVVDSKKTFLIQANRKDRQINRKA